MSTTVTLDDDIAVLLKEELRGRDGTLNQTVNVLLREMLLARRVSKNLKPFEVRSRAMGRSGFDYDNIPALLEQIEGPSHR